MTPAARNERGLNSRAVLTSWQNRRGRNAADCPIQECENGSKTPLGNPRESRPVEDRIRLKRHGPFVEVLLCGGFGGAPLLHEQRNAGSVSILSEKNLQ